MKIAKSAAVLACFAASISSLGPFSALPAFNTPAYAASSDAIAAQLQKGSVKWSGRSFQTE
ncbi:MAG: hypothetical protein AAGM04_10935, partial [Pseudomonadota bacterium]